MVKIDKNLIFLISENARIKINETSFLLKKSPQRLKYSINTLEKEDLLHLPHTILDYSYFGQMLFKVYFKGGYIGEKDKAEIIEKLDNNPFVTSIYEMSGEFDLAVEIECSNPSRFNKELVKITSDIPTLNNFKTVLNVVTYIFPRNYLTKESTILNNATQQIIIGGDREKEQFSENELKLVKNLIENPKIRINQLAKNCNINPKTATNLINNLKQRKVLMGFKTLPGAEKLNISKFRFFIKLHNITEKREQDLRQYLFETPEIIQLNKTIGDWNLELDVESLDNSKIRKLIIELRQKFKDLIENFNSIEYYNIYKKSFLPKNLFDI